MSHFVAGDELDVEIKMKKTTVIYLLTYEKLAFNF